MIFFVCFQDVIFVFVFQMKFVEAILTNNSTDDHCREFVTQKGLEPLMSVLGLPNLPIDFPTSPACQTVAIVCKSILVSKHLHMYIYTVESFNSCGVNLLG